MRYVAPADERLEGDWMLSCLQRSVSPFSLLTFGLTGLSGERLEFAGEYDSWTHWNAVGSTAWISINLSFLRSSAVH